MDSFKIIHPKFIKFKNYDIITNNYYVIKDSPQARIARINLKPDLIVRLYEQGYFYIFIEGEIEYLNIITNTKRIYSYIAKLTYKKNEPLYQEFLLNDNYNFRN